MRDIVQQFGPWALVTGASSGIGREIALELGKRGFGVVLSGRNEANLKSIADSIPNCITVVADLATDAGLRHLLQRVADVDLGLVVANAGFGTAGSFIGSDLSQELEMLKVNCEVPMQLARELGPRLASRGKGGFVFVSSIVAWQGVAGQAHYSATKAYVQNLSEGLAREWKPLGLHVLSAAPGPVATGFAERSHLALQSTDDARSVARDIVNALGKHSLVIPGRLGKFLTGMLSVAPRRLRIGIMSNVAATFIKG